MKYLASYCVAGWLLLVVLALAWLGNVSRSGVAAPSVYADTAVGDPAAGQAALSSVQAALLELRGLDAVLNTPLVEAPLIALAPDLQQAPLTAGTSAVAVAGLAPPVVRQRAEPQQRTLSLVYVSAGFHRAVIDGLYVQAGSPLPGNGRVLEIQRDAVVISEAGVRRVLKVDSRANVLGRATPAGS